MNQQLYKYRALLKINTYHAFKVKRLFSSSCIRHKRVTPDTSRDSTRLGIDLATSSWAQTVARIAGFLIGDKNKVKPFKMTETDDKNLRWYFKGVKDEEIVKENKRKYSEQISRELKEATQTQVSPVNTSFILMDATESDWSLPPVTIQQAARIASSSRLSRIVEKIKHGWRNWDIKHKEPSKIDHQPSTFVPKDEWILPPESTSLKLLPNMRRMKRSAIVYNKLKDFFGISWKEKKSAELWGWRNRKYNKYMISQYRRLMFARGKAANKISPLIQPNGQPFYLGSRLAKANNKYWNLAYFLLGHSTVFRTIYFNHSFSRWEKYQKLEIVLQILHKVERLVRTGGWTNLRITRCWIEEGKRPLGVPASSHRVIGAMLAALLEFYVKGSIVHNHAYQHKRGTGTAWQEIFDHLIRRNGKGTGWPFIFEYDIEGFFNNLSHKRITELLRGIGCPSWLYIGLLRMQTNAPNFTSDVPEEEQDDPANPEWNKSQSDQIIMTKEAWSAHGVGHKGYPVCRSQTGGPSNELFRDKGVGKKATKQFFYEGEYNRKGVAQGHNLSPLLSILVLDWALQCWKAASRHKGYETMVVQYADDGILASTDPGPMYDFPKILEDLTGCRISIEKSRWLRVDWRWGGKAVLKFLGLVYNPNTERFSAHTRKGSREVLERGFTEFIQKFHDGSERLIATVDGDALYEPYQLGEIKEGRINHWNVRLTPERVPDKLKDFLNALGILLVEVAKRHGSHGYIRHQSITWRSVLKAKKLNAFMSRLYSGKMKDQKVVQNFNLEGIKDSMLDRLLSGGRLVTTEPGPFNSNWRFRNGVWRNENNDPFNPQSPNFYKEEESRGAWVQEQAGNPYMWLDQDKYDRMSTKPIFMSVKPYLLYYKSILEADLDAKLTTFNSSTVGCFCLIPMLKAMRRRLEFSGHAELNVKPMYRVGPKTLFQRLMDKLNLGGIWSEDATNNTSQVAKNNPPAPWDDHPEVLYEATEELRKGYGKSYAPHINREWATSRMEAARDTFLLLIWRFLWQAADQGIAAKTASSNPDDEWLKVPSTHGVPEIDSEGLPGGHWVHAVPAARTKGLKLKKRNVIHDQIRRVIDWCHAYTDSRHQNLGADRIRTLLGFHSQELFWASRNYKAYRPFVNAQNNGKLWFMGWLPCRPKRKPSDDQGFPRSNPISLTEKALLFNCLGKETFYCVDREGENWTSSNMLGRKDISRGIHMDRRTIRRNAARKIRRHKSQA